MFVLIVIGLIIGLVLGLTGAGGSVFAVPLLMVFLNLPVQDAMGLALAAVSLSAFYGIGIRWQSRQFFLMPALLLGGTGIITAPVGKWLAAQTPELLLHILFSGLAVLLSLKMWFQANKQPESTQVVRASVDSKVTDEAQLCRYGPEGKFELKPRCIRGLLMGGLGIGFLSGFLGVGGGFMIIPILLFMSQMPMSIAVGTSLLIIAPVSLSGFISYCLITPEVSAESIAWIAVGGVAGMTVGTGLARVLAGPYLQKIFSVSLVALVVFNWVFTQ